MHRETKKLRIPFAVRNGDLEKILRELPQFTGEEIKEYYKSVENLPRDLLEYLFANPIAKRIGLALIDKDCSLDIVAKNAEYLSEFNMAPEEIMEIFEKFICEYKKDPSTQSSEILKGIAYFDKIIGGRFYIEGQQEKFDNEFRLKFFKNCIDVAKIATEEKDIETTYAAILLEQTNRDGIMLPFFDIDKDCSSIGEYQFQEEVDQVHESLQKMLYNEALKKFQRDHLPSYITTLDQVAEKNKYVMGLKIRAFSELMDAVETDSKEEVAYLKNIIKHIKADGIYSDLRDPELIDLQKSYEDYICSELEIPPLLVLGETDSQINDYLKSEEGQTKVLMEARQLISKK